AADLYSLGCVIFECLTGESPYAGMDMATAMYAHIHEPIPSAGDPGLDELFARALAKDPAGRFPSGQVLADAVDNALGGVTVAPARTARPAQPVRRRLSRRRRAGIGAGVAVLALLVLLAVLAFLGRGGGG